MMDLDLSQLSALKSAVAEGTFDAAARTLRITPSAVSQRIKALENSVGRVLLRRSKPIAPTESGRALLRLARQLEALTDDVARELDDPGDDRAASAAGAPSLIRMPLAVNADSLATWILPALAPLAGEIAFDLWREDQSQTTGLLREGTVMAAITSVAEPVQGCSSRALGVMRYRAVAAPSFAERWFADDLAQGLHRAPVVVFDRADELQDGFLRDHGLPSSTPPRHFVPASADFAEAVRLGFGWGMLPDQQSVGLGLIEIDPGSFSDVPLYWQQWQLHTTALDRVANTVAAAAAAALRPVA
ncbi:LysR family transcriptional regulator ArgP [Herbiconiux sp.]|uniref:LysR family transcriptional regulator ArgP n=1 Tax=Herbiconiux sp. TaxID=1871186 RepID=UPI0025C19D7A|nr:LysR family transcriptional regulator ArgP [Herbiconiux sp.]